MTSGIYQIRHIPSGRFYLGSSQDIEYRWVCHIEDLDQQCHVNPYLQNLWNKYSRDDFILEILEKVEGDRAFLYQIEQEVLDRFAGTSECLNLCPIAGAPSNKGKIRSEEARQKWRQTYLSKPQEVRDEENRRRSDSNRRTKALQTDEQRGKGRKLPPRSEETRKKMSEARKNMSERTRRKMSESAKQRDPSTRFNLVEYLRNKRGSQL